MANQGKSKTFAALAVYNYRLFFFAALVSNVGTWMGRTAQDWLVLTQLTNHSSTALGVVTALQFGPMLFLAPYGGVIADRFPKRTILIITQALLGLNQLALFVLVATHTIQLWHVYVIALLMAATTAVDNPARQAFASEVVGPDLLSNAVGLNSASFNFARLIGPGAAGLLIAAFGVAPAMALNAASFAAVIGGMVAMHPGELHVPPARKGRGSLREGFSYVRRRPDIMLITAIIFVFGALGMNFQITNLIFSTQVFHQGAEAYGAVGSIMAIGSLSGALMAARRQQPKLAYILWALTGFAILSFAMALAPTFLVYLILIVPVGMVSITAMNNANARIQLSVAPSLRGRVMSLYMAVFMGSTLVGAPFVGWAGDAWGPRWTLLVGSLGTAVAVIGALVYLAMSHQIDKRTVRHALPLPERWFGLDPTPAEAVVQQK